ncbi:unnamed protein product, partial [Dibothriocephalus latus]
GSPRPTSATPLSRLPQQSSTSSTETSRKEDPDSAALVDCWPPPLSHLPSSSPSKDAAQLASFITTSSNKRVSKVEARCRAQQSRAHRLHPLLYAAPNQDDSETRFSAILYPNRFHLPMEVMMILRNSLNCSPQRAFSAASLTVRDGRTPLLTSVPFSIASKLCKRVMAALGEKTALAPFLAIYCLHVNLLLPYTLLTSQTSSVRPLRVDIVDCNIYALEQFFLCFLRWLQRLVSEVQPLRPLICNALLGRYVAFSAGATAEGSYPAPETQCLSPGKMMTEQSLLARYFDQIHSAYGGLRKSLMAVITASLLQETFYRTVYAIEHIRVS